MLVWQNAAAEQYCASKGRHQPLQQSTTQKGSAYRCEIPGVPALLPCMGWQHGLLFKDGESRAVEYGRCLPRDEVPSFATS